MLARVVNDSKIRVTVTRGSDAGQTRELASCTLRVGSGSDNGLALTDNTVSRHHCAIEPMPSGVRIRDVGSANGVFIGSVRVFDALVNGPVQLRLGDSVLAIEPLEELPDAVQRAERAREAPAPPPPAAVGPLMPLRIARREATEAFERAYLANVLKRTQGNVTRAAALAEVSRQMMQKLLRKHGRGPQLDRSGPAGRHVPSESSL
jgi:hypothetical protein